MVYVVITTGHVPCVKVLVYDRFVFIRVNVNHLSTVKNKWHTVYDPRYLVNAYHGMSFTEDQFVCLEVVSKHLKHFFKAVCAAAASPVCQLCRDYESLKIKHFELLPSFARSPPKACPYHRETVAECTDGLPSLVSPYIPYYLNLFLDLLLDL